MEQTPYSPQVTNKKTKKSNKALKIIPWVGLGLFVVTVALGGYLYATKQLTLAIGGTESTNPRATMVCGDEVITKYNAAILYQIRGSQDEPTQDTKALKDIQTEVAGKAGYENDATCQTITFWLAVHDLDQTKAQTSLDALKKLHDEGKYPDSNLSTNVPLSTYQNTVDSLKVQAQPQG